ncbi:phage portal protein [Sphingomonas hengshuiensis]|uniref:Portal protein n=1 Tax=Sphingomonas hengshuiensis TaxID=1609977 RepID=A0A7U4J8L7_9SPHN|nr:phage portal protein [Sphingomonas hengshuiensis]AJP72272.1 portal protein [Sphingomonas hengshuiensis]
MGFGDILDGVIAPIAPTWAARRMAARTHIAAAQLARDGVRAYDAASYNRRTANWNRQTNSINGETLRYRKTLAAAGWDLFQNNKYAAAGVRQQVAAIWGDGIAVQITHPVKRVRERAQADWDRWAESKVDDLGDWYGHGKVDIIEMIVGGEGLTVWQGDRNDGPFNSIVGKSGVELDASKNFRLTDGGKIVQGVQYNSQNRRTGYWLFGEHPNDPLGTGRPSQFVDAAYVDHMFERVSHGQARGVSWLGAVAMTLQDIAEIEDARRLSEKIQNCLSLIITPAEGQGTSPLGVQGVAPGSGPADGARPLGESISPGMIARTLPGEQVQVVNPQPSNATVQFLQQQLAGVSANMVPYHLMTGDVSQANYSGLRAAMNGSYGLLDDWQQNVVIPLKCKPAVMRRMQRLAWQTGDARFLDVGMTFALPVRRLVDPVKDLLGELMEVRAGWKLTTKAMAERGLNGEAHIREIARINAMLDELKLALDSDPRKLTDSGVLQAAAPYLYGGAPNQGN